jgi:TRAP-type C4-dicarboxylate transport system permease small subunit
MIYLSKQRVLSLIVAVGCVIFFAAGPDTQDFLSALIVLVFALVLIWFGDELGEMTGNYANFHQIDQKSPGCLVRLVGWMFLSYPVIRIILNLTGKSD